MEKGTWDTEFQRYSLSAAQVAKLKHHVIISNQFFMG
jgi:hypothetical protein